jgi:hypothetical protein
MADGLLHKGRVGGFAHLTVSSDHSQQLVVRAALHDLTFLHNRDFVHRLDACWR